MRINTFGLIAIFILTTGLFAKEPKTADPAENVF